MGNTTTTNNKKKKSNARKLIPAIGMLMTSAAMLTTSTYAWFTMNKEVSIKGIELTASVPETLEISLGNVSGPQGDGFIKTVNDPTNSESSTEWSNTFTLRQYYGDSFEFGTLLPVSSSDGYNMVFTDDAIGNGRDLDLSANLVKVESQSIAALEAKKERYYLDIPVWFRTTAKGDGTVDLAVEATISKGTNSNENSDLYKAARFSILDVDEGGIISSQNLKGVGFSSEARYNSEMPDGQYNAQGGRKAFNNSADFNDSITKQSCYQDVDVLYQNYTADKETVVSVPKADANNRYGTAKPMIIRIWLEGEDYYCYNPNAGQDFVIGLTFAAPASSKSTP